MYETFYHLREKPFTLLPDPGFLYMSDKHSMALNLLEYSLMNHTGFTVISGEIGTGKTTLIRHVLNNMDRDHTVGLISTTHRSFGELLQWILLAFNLDHANMSKVEMYQRFVDFIIDEYAHNRSTVLIVDEAQNLPAEVLEELRMLSNINADKDQALQIILVGQRELRDTLQRPELAQFAQRISVDFHLQPLTEDETVTYIRHRLQTAGGDPDIFDLPACHAVYRYSSGVPRLINVLCDTALVYGYADQTPRINEELVTTVAHEKQQGGIFPTLGSAALQTGLAAATASEPAPAESPEAQADTLTGDQDPLSAHGFTAYDELHTLAADSQETEPAATATASEPAPAEDPEAQAEALTDDQDQLPAEGSTADDEHPTLAADVQETEPADAATASETSSAEDSEVQAETLTDIQDLQSEQDFTADDEQHTLAAAVQEIELTAAATAIENAPAEDPEAQAEALSDAQDLQPKQDFTADDEQHTLAAAAQETELTAAAMASETASAEGSEAQAEALTDAHDPLPAQGLATDDDHHLLEELDSFITAGEAPSGESPEAQAEALTDFQDQLSPHDSTSDGERRLLEELDSFISAGESPPGESPEAQAESLTDIHDQLSAHGSTTDDELHTLAAAEQETELTATATASETAPVEAPEAEAEAEAPTDDQDRLDAHGFTADDEYLTPAAAAATASETLSAEAPEAQAEALTESLDEPSPHDFTSDDEPHPPGEPDSVDTKPANDIDHDDLPGPGTQSGIDFGPVVAELLMDDKANLGEQRGSKRKVRLAICSAHDGFRIYLEKLLQRHGIDVVKTAPLYEENLMALNPAEFDVLLIDRDEYTAAVSPDLGKILAGWSGPLLYNDTQAMKTALRHKKYEFGKTLASRIEAIADAAGARTDT